MEKRERRPVHINFNNTKEAIDMFHRIELKYFLLTLLYKSCETNNLIVKKANR